MGGAYLGLLCAELVQRSHSLKFNANIFWSLGSIRFAGVKSFFFFFPAIKYITSYHIQSTRSFYTEDALLFTILIKSLHHRSSLLPHNHSSFSLKGSIVKVFHFLLCLPGVAAGRGVTLFSHFPWTYFYAESSTLSVCVISFLPCTAL